MAGRLVKLRSLIYEGDLNKSSVALLSLSSPQSLSHPSLGGRLRRRAPLREPIALSEINFDIINNWEQVAAGGSESVACWKKQMYLTVVYRFIPALNPVFVLAER